MEQPAKTAVTQADLQRYTSGEDDVRVEVEDGEIIAIEAGVTFLHLIIIQNLFLILHPFTQQHKLGHVYMDGVRYILIGANQNIKRARMPDLSFLRAGRIPADFDWTGDFVGAPDLAVEVASPGQTNQFLLGRVTGWLDAGSEEAWLIYPSKRAIHVYRRDAAEPAFYGEADEIDLSPLFPGLTFSVKAVFATP